MTGETSDMRDRADRVMTESVVQQVRDLITIDLGPRGVHRSGRCRYMDAVGVALEWAERGQVSWSLVAEMLRRLDPPESRSGPEEEA